MTPAPDPRVLRKLGDVVASLELDLSGRTVLTEAATGPYVVTPILAALAGAQVYAYAVGNRYATSEGAVAELRGYLDTEPLRGCADLITPVTEVTPGIVAAADVITNSGNLRPLDDRLLQHARPGAVVPLMFEAWEWREADLDLAYLRSRGIPLVATNERHPRVDVFGYLGEMAVKLIQQAGRCVHNNRFTLVTNNPFGPFMAHSLLGLGAEVAVLDTDENRAGYADLDVHWLGGFPTLDDLGPFRSSEAILVALYPFEQPWISEGGVFEPAAIAAAFDDPLVLRYAGHADPDQLGAHGIAYHPDSVKPGHMGILPSALGFDPIIRLQAAGLRAAQAALDGSFELDGQPIAELL